MNCQKKTAGQIRDAGVSGGVLAHMNTSIM